MLIRQSTRGAVPSVIFPAMVTRKVNVSFVSQAYPGIQLSANEKKRVGSICSAQKLRNCLRVQGAKGGEFKAPGRAYLG